MACHLRVPKVVSCDRVPKVVSCVFSKKKKVVSCDRAFKGAKLFNQPDYAYGWRLAEHVFC